eukprot:6037500-Alexandrium_andersonii.AAC.1
MSASLVGSEMCIRDRDSLPKRHGPRRPHIPSLGQGRFALQAYWDRNIAVSYTHLTLRRYA